jgi:hypothetical protein
MTEKQDLFDRIVTHCFNQGFQSVDDTGSCMYRGEEGRSCAVGCLIPDEMYDPSIERKIYDMFNVSDNSYREAIYEYLGGEEHVKFLRLMQLAHDNTENWATEETLRKAFAHVAHDFKLNTDVFEGLHFPLQRRLQEIFDTVASHLFEQGKRATDHDGRSCAYRGLDGTSCAVGCLIPDELYDTSIEFATYMSFSFRATPARQAIFEALGGHDTYELLKALQSAHDEPVNWESEVNMRATLSAIASRFDLNPYILEYCTRFGN